MDILLFGGSFDPPHRGHLQMLTAAMRRYPKARAILVPAYRSPFKTETAATPAERLALTRAVLKDLPAPQRRRAEVSNFEISSGRATYTYETLEHFTNKNPDAQLTFLMGSDTYAQLRQWKRPEQVQALAQILVGRRPGTAPPRGAQVLPGVFPDISSTQLRARLLVGEKVTADLGKATYKHIVSRKLYGLAHHQRLAKELNSNRYQHTLGVAQMALELALRHDQDSERAALAGLLHDCGRSVPIARMAAHCRKHNIEVPERDEIIARQPLLLHAYISAQRARSVYGIGDAAVLSAIAKHTLGDTSMLTLDRLIFTADACSRDRRYAGATAVRSAALKNLDAGFRLAIKNKLADVIGREAWIHPLGRDLWNSWVAE
jgi:nicotinate-nucleotide adenylyltransferase